MFTVLIVYHYHDISFSIDKGLSSSDVAGVVAGVVAIILTVATGTGIIVVVVVVVMWRQKKVMSSL